MTAIVCMLTVRILLEALTVLAKRDLKEMDVFVMVRDFRMMNWPINVLILCVCTQ